MKYILFIIILLAGGGFYGYTMHIENQIKIAQENCVASFKAGNPFEPNAKEFCACSSEYIRENPFADKKDPEVKKQIGITVSNCMDKYNKPIVITECDKMNDQMKQANTGYFVECSCFYDNLIEPILAGWVDGDIKTNEMAQAGKDKAVDALNACMKMN